MSQYKETYESQFPTRCTEINKDATVLIISNTKENHKFTLSLMGDYNCRALQ